MVPCSDLSNSFGPNIFLCLLTGFGFSFPPHFYWSGQGGNRASQASPVSPGLPTGYPALTSYLLGSFLDLPIWGAFLFVCASDCWLRWPVGRWLKGSSNPFRQLGPSSLSSAICIWWHTSKELKMKDLDLHELAWINLENTILIERK